MLEIRHLTKKYDEVILDDLSVTFPDCGLVVIYGESGCGKSTLLHLLARLDNHYEGQIFYNGENIKNMKNYIKNNIGFVFQNMYFINDLKVKENALLSSYFKKIYYSHINVYLKKLKLEKFQSFHTMLLSRGQKQRVAIMRSFIADHPLVLCDEPTGSLDQKNSEQIFSLLQKLSQEKLVIVVSHDLTLARKYSHYLYHLQNGKLFLEKEHLCPKKNVQKKKGKKPFFLLLMKLWKMSWKRNLFMIQIVFVALFCILMTFSITKSTKLEIQQQIEQLIPSSTVMCKRKDNQEITLQELSSFDKEYIQYHCMEYSDIELLGLSLDEKWNSEQMLYVSDYIQKCQGKLLKGKQGNNDEDIILSHSTYQHLCKIYQKKSLLNQKCFLFLQKDDLILSLPVNIAGVSSQKTAVDTIYLKEDAYAHFCKKLFQVENGQICFLQVNESQNIEKLKKDFPFYQFQLANESIQSSIDEKMNQLENILLYFSFLAVISACFLLGEVLYLNVMKRRKIFALFKSMGASSSQISFLVLSQGLLVSVIAYLQAVILLNTGIDMINQMIMSLLNMTNETFMVIDKGMVLIVFIIMIMLTIISCYMPVKKANQIDIIEEIKG